MTLIVVPATAAEDNDEDNEDTESASSDTNDNGQLLRIRNMDTRSCEGQGDILLRHAPIVDGDTGVLAEVVAGN